MYKQKYIKYKKKYLELQKKNYKGGVPYEDTKKYNYYKLVKINKDEINDLDKTIKYGDSHIDETSILQIEKKEKIF